MCLYTVVYVYLFITIQKMKFWFSDHYYHSKNEKLVVSFFYIQTATLSSQSYLNKFEDSLDWGSKLIELL